MDGESSGGEEDPRVLPRRPSGIAIAALLLGLLVTAALVVTARIVYDHNEHRLLRLRGRELELVLSGLVPSVQAPLASAVELADLTHGNVSRFRAVIGADVGRGREFASVSLWKVSGAVLERIATRGSEPQIDSSAPVSRGLLRSAQRASGLDVVNMLDADAPSLAYLYVPPGSRDGYAIYAESPLPKDRRLEVPSGDGLTGLHYALYLGRNRARRNLLLTDLGQPSISGEKASFAVPFGSSFLTLVVTPSGSLGGTFFDDLPWIIAIGGVLVALAAALMTESLARRRLQAEALAGTLDHIARENRVLYTEQRSIAKTLQHALLPEALPHVHGLQSCARYVPAAAGMDVGGDWYDLVAKGPRRALLLIGDVSGHGLPAATTMAALRHAALAYGAQEDAPATILTRLADFVNSTAHDYFATVLCALIDVDAHTVVFASAGHPAPLLIEDGHGRFAELEVGVPIGVQTGETSYREVRVPVSREATLITYTDGLVERRGESLDVGMARLRDAAVREPLELSALVETLARELGSDDKDDTAILGVRWMI